MAKDGLSNVAFAKLIGVTEGAVRKKRKAGKLTDWAPDNPGGSILPDGSIHAERGRAEYFGDAPLPDEAKRSISGPRPQSHPEAQNLNRLKAAKLATELKLSQLELKQREGELIPIEEAKAELRAFARLHRDGLLNFASRYGGQIAADAGAESVLVIAALDKFIRIHLDETAGTDIPFESGDDGG